LFLDLLLYVPKELTHYLPPIQVMSSLTELLVSVRTSVSRIVWSWLTILLQWSLFWQEASLTDSPQNHYVFIAKNGSVAYSRPVYAWSGHVCSVGGSCSVYWGDIEENMWYVYNAASLNLCGPSWCYQCLSCLPVWPDISANPRTIKCSRECTGMYAFKNPAEEVFIFIIYKLLF
jgi:hypothetical protein